jgi:S-adenosylmethionine hydrolase
MKGLRACVLACLALGLPSCTRLRPEPRSDLLVLLTDFGNRDYYVGAITGAAYRANPRVRIETITHEIAPFDVREGAVTLSLAAREFPPGTVFVGVVDPGVGTERGAIVLRTKAGRIYVAPDNGLLTLVAENAGIAEVRDLSGFQPFGRTPSKTFHGRDLFVPTGALLAGGFPMRRVGPKLDGIKTLAFAKPAFDAGVLEGTVMRIDRYGNVVTNIPAELVRKAGWAKGDTVGIRLGERKAQATFATTYGDVAEGKALCLLDSHGRLELAINRGSMAEHLKARAGQSVELRKEE